MYVVGYNPLEANLANQNARYTLDAIRNFIVTGIPLSPGKWIAQPTITVTDNLDGTVTLDVSAGTADWNGIEQPYVASQYANIALPTAPLQQFLAVAALEDGTFELKTGNQSQTPETPTISTGALLVNYVLLTSDGGAVEQPPQTGITESRVLELLGDYLKKVEPAGDGTLFLANDNTYKAIPSGPATGQATAEEASATLNFANPFGHIRNEALTGAQTFAKQGTVLGSTIVQSYTANGSGALTFDFPHTVLNSDFVSGSALAAGEYKLFFSNWGDTVAVSIATVGAGTSPAPNQGPAANAGPDQSITLPTNSVTLTGSGTDGDGSIASYQWAQVSGPSTIVIGSPNSATATASGLIEGSYVFRLTVTDNGGLTATDDVTVNVNPSGTPEDTTPPTAPQNIVISNVTTSGYTATADPSTDA
jgi:hypothetical protein